ncbi:MAG TPA: LamG-like jellyroll fold domain-containing protein [Candidatus Norongarragalinales archaeon]|jgi:hypothetical protein|nr:LamG-like jellyroll fold domain-containing protein [Candidatus Norongarragalinales archaeon]
MRWLFFALVAFLALSGSVSAFWFNTSWQFKQPINTTYRANMPQLLNDTYTLNITLDTATLIAQGKLDANCRDLRIVYNDTQTLDWWNDTPCNNATTVIWFRARTNMDASSGINTEEMHNVYYGYNGTTPIPLPSQNLTKIYYWYEDWSGYAIGSNGSPGWLPTVNQYNVTNGTLATNNTRPSGLDQNVYNTTGNTDSNSKVNTTYAPFNSSYVFNVSNAVFEYWLRAHGDPTGNWCGIHLHRTGGGSHDGLLVYTQNRLQVFSAANGVIATNSSASVPIPQNVWIKYQVFANGSNYNVSVNGTPSLNFSNTNYAIGGFDVAHNGVACTWSDIKIRNYTDPEPTTSSCREDTVPGTGNVLNVTDCCVLDKPNKIYTLTRDFNTSVTTGCFIIAAQNVTLDCKGHIMNSTNGGSAILLGSNGGGGRGSMNGNASRVQNCIVSQWSNGIQVNSTNNTIFNNTLYNNTSSGVLLTANNNTADSNNYTLNGIGLSIGPANINSPAISNITVIREIITNSSLNGIRFIRPQSNVLVESVRINFSTDTDIRINSNASLVFRNTTFNRTLNNDTSLWNLTVQWFVFVRLLDLATNNAIVAGAANITNSTGHTVSNGSTDANGYLSQQNVTEYYQNSTGLVNATNHTFGGGKAAYFSNATLVNVTSSMNYTLYLAKPNIKIADFRIYQSTDTTTQGTGTLVCNFTSSFGNNITSGTCQNNLQANTDYRVEFKLCFDKLINDQDAVATYSFGNHYHKASFSNAISDVQHADDDGAALVNSQDFAINTGLANDYVQNGPVTGGGSNLNSSSTRNAAACEWLTYRLNTSALNGNLTANTTLNITAPASGGVTGTALLGTNVNGIVILLTPILNIDFLAGFANIDFGNVVGTRQYRSSLDNWTITNHSDFTSTGATFRNTRANRTVTDGEVVLDTSIANNGTYTSPILEVFLESNWTKFVWNSSTPGGTTLTFRTRSGNSSSPPAVDTNSTWFDSHYVYRQNINFFNIDKATLITNYTFNATIDTATLINNGKVRPDGYDLRVTFRNNSNNPANETELPRVNRQDNLALVLHFDENGTVNPGDESDFAQTAVMHQGASRLPSKTGFGNAVYLNGSSYINVTDRPSINTTIGMTAMFWMNATTYYGNNTNVAYMMSKYEKAPSPEGGWAIGILGTYAATCNSNDGVIIVHNGTDAPSLCGTFPINNNSYYHIAVVNNGTHTWLYINGTLNNETNQVLRATKTNLTIGARLNTGPEFFFNGTIDEVKLFNKPLSANEVLAQYSATTPLYKGMGMSDTNFLFRAQANVSGSANDTNYSFYYGWPSAPVPPQNLTDVYAYYENFEAMPTGSNAPYWNNSAATSTVQVDPQTGMQVLQTNTTTDGQYSYYALQNFTNFTIEVQEKILPGTGGKGGVLLRANASNNFYFWHHNTGGDFTFYSDIGGGVGGVASCIGCKLDTTGIYIMYSVKATGIRFVGFQDGKRMFNGTSGGIPFGFVGTVPWSGTDAHYENFSVRYSMEIDPIATNAAEEAGDGWSGWNAATNNSAPLSPPASFFQYQANLTTTSATTSPAVYDTRLNYTSNKTGFVIRNTGTALLNVTISSSTLFTGTGGTMPTAAYQFRAREYIDGSNALLNSPNSSKDWTNMTNTTAQIVFAALNYTTGNNTAVVDLRIQPPLDEPVGPHNATITFTATQTQQD